MACSGVPRRDKTVVQMPCRPRAQSVPAVKSNSTERRSRRRYGAPQVFAATMLLLFLVQCGWFVANVPLSQVEGSYIQRGIALLHGSRVIDRHHSPLVAEAAVAGILPIASRLTAAGAGPVHARSLSLAGTRAVSAGRAVSGSFRVVYRAPALWQRRRLRCHQPLLLHARPGGAQFAGRSGNFRRLGSVSARCSPRLRLRTRFMRPAPHFSGIVSA